MSTNPFSRNRRTTARPPFTFNRPSQPSPTQNFPLLPDHRPSGPSRPLPPTNTIPRASGHAPNPFHLHCAVPIPTHAEIPNVLPPPPPRPPPPFSSHAPPQAAYTRAQASAYTCGCPVRLYTNHAQHCAGPVSTHATPLGRAGNAGSATASEPPLARRAASALLLVGRLCLTGLGEFASWVASVVAAAVGFVAYTVAPEVRTIGLGLGCWAVVGFVAWWVLITAANVMVVWTTWKEPAAYYALTRKWLFLGNVSPLGDGGVLTTASADMNSLVTTKAAHIEQVIEAVKNVATYVAPAETAGATARLLEAFSHRTVHLESWPAFGEMTLFPRRNIAATEMEAGIALLPVVPMAVS